MTKTALITGVSRRRGIGAGIATALAADNWSLAISYWRGYDERRLGLDGSDEDPATWLSDLSTTGARIEKLPVDLSDAAGPERLFDEATRRLGAIDALVLSHCESVDSSVLTTSVESFDRHYAVNVSASWLLIAAFARQLPPTGGSVVA